ncbi:hypothetical protein ACJJTC_018630 [Scirpophaga incertulas]
MPSKKRQRKPKQQAAMPATPAPKMPTRRRTATRRSQDIPTDEERSAASTPSPSPSTSRYHQTTEDQKIPPLPSPRKNVGELPTFASISRLPTSFADKAKTLADSQITRIPSLRDKQILPWYNTNPEDYPMPTITMIPGPGEVALCRSLERKMGKAIPAHVTRGGTRVHFNPASEAEYYLIWDHLIEHNAEIIRPENHQTALHRRSLQTQSTSAPYASSTPTPLQSATTSRDATPQRSPTPSMSANTPRSCSPARSLTPSLSANTPRSGSPRQTPDASPARSWTRPSTPEQMLTPRMSANPSRDASPTQPKTPNTPAMMSPSPDRTTPAPATILMGETTTAHTAQRTTPTPAATQMVDDSEPTAQNSLMAAANNQTTRRPVPSPRVRRHSENDTTKRQKRRKHKASRQPVPQKDATHSASATAQLQRSQNTQELCDNKNAAKSLRESDSETTKIYQNVSERGSATGNESEREGLDPEHERCHRNKNETAAAARSVSEWPSDCHRECASILQATVQHLRTDISPIFALLRCFTQLSNIFILPLLTPQA